MERLVTAFGEGNINADWMMYTGSAEESGELWFSPDNLGAEQHHPLQVSAHSQYPDTMISKYGQVDGIMV